MNIIQGFKKHLPPFLSNDDANATITNEMLASFYSIPQRYRNNGELSRYYILRWSYAFYELQPELAAGIIWHQGQRYRIAYGPAQLEIGRKKKSVMLSFRCPSIQKQKEGLIPTCYVTILSNEGN